MRDSYNEEYLLYYIYNSVCVCVCVCVCVATLHGRCTCISVDLADVLVYDLSMTPS